MSRSKKPEPLHMLFDLPEGIKLPRIIRRSKALPDPRTWEATAQAREDNDRHHQARLAHWLKKETARRLLGEEDLAVSSSGEMSRYDLCRMNILKLESELPKLAKQWVLQLPDLTLILDDNEAASYHGTLEARGSGFTFTAASGNFHMHFKDTSVKLAFFRKEEHQLPALLQFKLCQPMMVASSYETDSILFFLIPKKRKRATRTSADNDLENFAHSVSKAKWDSKSMFPMVQDLNCNCKVDDVLLQINGLEEKRVTFALTSSALVLMLVGVPYLMVSLTDIEIVNLVPAGSGGEDQDGVILMTVVFQDFTSKVLQISDIPLRMLASVKELLNIGDVKYYCNGCADMNWDSILGEILQDPKKFVESGGWESLDLEQDERTLFYYSQIADDEIKNQSDDGLKYFQ